MTAQFCCRTDRLEALSPFRRTQSQVGDRRFRAPSSNRQHGLYVLNWAPLRRGGSHAPDGIAASSGAFANCHDSCRYAFGHVICADADALEGSRLQRFAWFRRKQELHFVHHRHANCNFAVIHFFWDRILGTYRRPDAGQTQTNGTLRTGRPGRFPPFEADSSV
jgi:hypothetical protein